MEGCLEEDEIKIEYYDIPETDPLCEKLEENSIGCSDEIVSANTSQCEDPLSNNIISQFDDTDHHILSPDITISDKEQEYFEVYLNTEPTNKINWYREVDDAGKLVCQFCDRTYSTNQSIRHHVKTKHPTEANTLKSIIKNNRWNPKIKCHICKKRFKVINSLKEHIKEHYSENFVKSCQVCFAAFNNEQEMTEHMYQEHQKLTNIKTYSCTLCGYQTRKLSHFKQHRNTHILTKQLKCDSCDYATNYLSNLNNHQRIHTNYKPYSCMFGNCGYRSRAKSALTSHQLKHNPEANMLYCDKCTYRTVYKNTLMKHIDSHKRNRIKMQVY